MPAGIGDASNAVPALGNVPRRPGAGTEVRAYEARDKYHRLRAMGNAQAPMTSGFHRMVI